MKIRLKKKKKISEGKFQRDVARWPPEIFIHPWRFSKFCRGTGDKFYYGTFFPLQSSYTTCGAALLDPQSSIHPTPCFVKDVEFVINFMKIIWHAFRSKFAFFSLNGAKNTKGEPVSTDDLCAPMLWWNASLASIKVTLHWSFNFFAAPIPP